MIEADLTKVIEALLFVSEKPLTIKQVQEVCPQINANEIKKALKQLMDLYNLPERGIQIIEVAGGYQFCSHPDCEPYLSKLYRTKKVFRLSAPALETLAIIAYKQPVTRAEMEFIRGVNVDGVVKNLEDRELIKTKGRKEVPGRPLLYGTTDKFLHYFGLKSLQELPSLEEFAATALEKESQLEQDPEAEQEPSAEQAGFEEKGISDSPETEIEPGSEEVKTNTGEPNHEQTEHSEAAKSN